MLVWCVSPRVPPLQAKGFLTIGPKIGAWLPPALEILIRIGHILICSRAEKKNQTPGQRERFLQVWACFIYTRTNRTYYKILRWKSIPTACEGDTETHKKREFTADRPVHGVHPEPPTLHVILSNNMWGFLFINLEKNIYIYLHNKLRDSCTSPLHVMVREGLKP